jgi:hypothetical protein
MNAVATDSSENVGRWIRDLRGAMRELNAAVEALDLRVFEAIEPEAQSRLLRPAAETLLEDALELVASVLEITSEEEEPTEGTDSLSAAPQSHSRLDLGTVAFFAQLELRSTRERLRHVTQTAGPVALLGACDSSLRGIHKALGALDGAVSERCGSPTLFDFASDLDRSLRVRRCYGRFRDKMLAADAVPDDHPRRRLRWAGTAIAMLVGDKVYPELRVADRLQIRELQHRILAWLRLPVAASTHLAGHELWSDLMAFVGMLERINQRQELQEHDQRLLRSAASYAKRAFSSRFPEEFVAELRSLTGREPELDELLGSVNAGRIACWSKWLEAYDASPESGVISG